MSNYDQEFEDVIKRVQKILKDNSSEWTSRYKKYADNIDKNLNIIKDNKKIINSQHRISYPFNLYVNLSKAMGNAGFSLRYQGQEIGKLSVDKDKNVWLSVNKKIMESNKKNYGYNGDWNKVKWDSNEAREFIKHFSSGLERINPGKQNKEHRIESLLLSEFEKKTSIDKSFLGIQPVKIADTARFQMKTPISASKPDKIKYSSNSGGGIDILAHLNKGNVKGLGIMELKADNDTKLEVVLKQGLAYSVFINELLRSESGEKWWKIFNYNGQLPERLELYVVAVVPSKEYDNKGVTFSEERIFKLNDNDSVQLHYMLYEEIDKGIKID